MPPDTIGGFGAASNSRAPSDNASSPTGPECTRREVPAAARPTRPSHHPTGREFEQESRPKNMRQAENDGSQDRPGRGDKRPSSPAGQPLSKRLKGVVKGGTEDDPIALAGSHEASRVYRPLFTHNQESHKMTQDETSWINDETIKALVGLFAASNPGRVKVVDSLWLCPAKNPEEADKVRRRIEEYFKGPEIIMIPIHIKSRKHWVLAIIPKSRDKVQIFDSLPARTHKRQTEKILEQPFRDIPKAKRALRNTSITCPIPQLNGYDCGPIVLITAFYITIGFNVPLSDADVPSWRRIFSELLRPMLDWEKKIVQNGDRQHLGMGSGELLIELSQTAPWSQGPETMEVPARNVLEYCDLLVSRVRETVDGTLDSSVRRKRGCRVAPSLDAVVALRDKAVELGSLEAAVRLQRVVRSMEKEEQARQLKKQLADFGSLLSITPPVEDEDDITGQQDSDYSDEESQADDEVEDEESEFEGELDDEDSELKEEVKVDNEVDNEVKGEEDVGGIGRPKRIGW